MKNVSQAMSPREAAQAFYGQDEASFSEMVAKLSVSDPRMNDVFKSMRKRFVDGQTS
jgi:hypothetical protein